MSTSPPPDIPLDTLAPSRSSGESEVTKCSPTQLYSSLPLVPGSRTIRVLDLCCPKEVSATDALTGTLRVVNLKDSPAFTALSYVWGNFSPVPDTIRCGGFDIAITASCRDALLSLRQQYGPITIWVDAICINQDDDSEKAGQVGLMEEVYTWAREVYIWLGPGDERSERAITFLERVSRVWLTSVATLWIHGRSTKSVPSDALRSILSMAVVIYRSYHEDMMESMARVIYKCYHKHTKERYPSGVLPFSLMTRAITKLQPGDVLHLLDRTWLHRVWTFQEIILASNPVLVCGARSITWRQMHKGLGFVFWGNMFSDEKKDHCAARIRWIDGTPVDRWNALATWGYILSLWRRISRPTTWNGRTLRGLSTQKGTLDREACSVQDYEQQEVQMPSLYRWAFLLVCLLVVGVEATLVEIAIIARGGPVYGWFIFLSIVWGFNILFYCIFCPWHLLRLRDGSLLIWPFENTNNGVITTLISILNALRKRQASNAKDKAFAIHGVLRRLGVSLHPADYSRSLGGVYHDLFRDLLKWKPSLIALLSDVGVPLDGSPSWVPDWSTLESREWWGDYVYSPITRLESNPHLSIDWDSDSALTVQAVLLATASYCTGPISQPEADDRSATSDSLRHTVSVIVEWITHSRRYMPYRQHYQYLSPAVFHCLREPSWETWNEDPTFNEWYRILTKDYTQSPNRVNDIIDELRQNTATWEFMCQLCSRLGGRRGLFFSRDGHLGSGPPHMRQGDTIAVVAGVMMPLILRACGGDSYTVVGPALVYDLYYDVSYKFDAAYYKREWRRVTLV